MIISQLPHEESPDQFDTIIVALKFKQAIFVTTNSQALPATAVKNPVQQSTVNTGEQQAGLGTVLPPPVVDGTGSDLPQIPGPASRSTLNVPPIPPGAPFNPAQYQNMYDAANFGANP